MINGKLGKMGAAALRKTIQDIVGLNLSSIRYLVYVLLRACLKIAGMNFQTRSRKRRLAGMAGHCTDEIRQVVYKI